MDVSWNKTIEGIQYFVSVSFDYKLEYSFDHVNPLVGSGATFELKENMENGQWVWGEIQKLFGAEGLENIYALMLTLKQVSQKEFETRSSLFYTVYEEQITAVKKSNILKKLILH